MTINSILIPQVECYYNASYIAKTLNKLGILKVSNIYFKKYPKNNKNHIYYKMAFVNIKYWHETEAAYNFIQKLHNDRIEAKLVHSDDNWWVVKKLYAYKPKQKNVKRKRKNKTALKRMDIKDFDDYSREIHNKVLNEYIQLNEGEVTAKSL